MGRFPQQFKDVADINKWMDRETLLHLQSSQGGNARVYGSSGSVQEAFDSVTTRYGLSARQAKEHLLELEGASDEYVFDLELKTNNWSSLYTSLCQLARGDEWPSIP